MASARRDPCWRRWCKKFCYFAFAAITVAGLQYTWQQTARHLDVRGAAPGVGQVASPATAIGQRADTYPTDQSSHRSHAHRISTSPKKQRPSLPSKAPPPRSSNSQPPVSPGMQVPQAPNVVASFENDAGAMEADRSRSSRVGIKTTNESGSAGSGTAGNLVVCPHPGSSKGPIRKEDCSGPEVPPALPDHEREALRKRLTHLTQAWGYYHSHEHHWKSLKGKRILDIGMGQGPIGVVALKYVSSYTGLDPGVCINHRPCVRNKQVARTMQPRHCEALEHDSICGGKCKEYMRCSKDIEEKYKKFELTGVQMMQAYRGELVLLPGTFETLDGTNLLHRGAYDVATLWSVTEHLPNNHLVVEGAYNLLKAGQYLCVSHHNFYCYDGHHSVPQAPDDFDPKLVTHRLIANWKHINVKTERNQNGTINHVRLGDLMALLDVYFVCSWRAKVGKGHRAALTRDIQKPLLKLGFTVTELLVQRLFARCQRRARKLDAPWLHKAVWWLPPEDGSYSSQELPPKLVHLVERDSKDNAAIIGQGDTEHFCGV